MDYELIYQECDSFIDKEMPTYSVLANISAVLNQIEDINWCGFYLVQGDELYLGPFQGEVACMLIEKGRGVCGTAFEKAKTIIVPNVHEFSGHIACSCKSRSEIVTPIIKDGKVVGVIDIDSPSYDRFHEEEKILLEKIADLLSGLKY